MKRIPGGRGGFLHALEKGETANPNGRPRRIFSEIAKTWNAQGVQRATAARVVEAYEYLLALREDEVQAIADGGEGADQYPVIIRIAAKELTGPRKQEILKEMLDRAHGKATQRQELTGANGAELPASTVVFNIQYRDPEDPNAASDEKAAKASQSKKSSGK
jgi:hypothetical protein